MGPGLAKAYAGIRLFLNRFVLEDAMTTFLVKFLVSLVLIAKGADWFTEAAVRIARATRIPQVIIGATVVSFATTIPEFSVSTYSAMTAKADYAVGNAIGSTICNIGLILGTCMIIRPMIIDRSFLIMRQGLIMIGTGALVTLLGIDGTLSRPDSLILLLVFAGYIYYSIQIAKRERKRNLSKPRGEGSESSVKLWREILFFLIGSGCVVLGSKWLVTSAEFIARSLGVPDLIIGVTIVAVGTSLPEYVTALTATIKGYQEISVGNIMGADILDILWVLGASSLLSSLPIQFQTRVLDFPVMLVSMIALTFFARTRNRITRTKALMFFMIYVAYLIIMFLKFRA